VRHADEFGLGARQRRAEPQAVKSDPTTRSPTVSVVTVAPVATTSPTNS
jgi:hypothetical protein